MFKASMQYFVKSICLTLLVFHCFPAENLCIWWNVTSLIISLISYMTHTHRFTSWRLCVCCARWSVYKFGGCSDGSYALFCL